MTGEEFVRALKYEAVDSANNTYRTLLETTDRAAVTDAYWRRLLDLYDKLTPTDRDMLLAIMRQVSVDAVSTVLGVLDGVSLLPGQSDMFHVADSSSPLASIAGDLQDEFLAAMEDESI